MGIRKPVKFKIILRNEQIAGNYILHFLIFFTFATLSYTKRVNMGYAA